MTELRRRVGLALLGAVVLSVGVVALSAAEEPSSAPDPLAALGHRVTSGAAPGYVDSKLCGLCHQERFQSYQSVGMARSFYSAGRVASGERRIEDFSGEGYFHEPSRRWYRIEPRGDGLVFRRWQTGPEGEPILELELPIDWVLGSGNHSRVYLYQNGSGELFQLPLAWYSQENGGRGSWFMAPGYDRPDHEGVLRPVRRECMFCHNAYPDVPEGSDAFYRGHTFPTDLPEGTGCQRCHGPGAEHVRRALSPDGTAETVRATIVNPARLESELRNSVCYECHMEPSVAFPGVRRFGRGDYSFRPGELLDDYRVQLVTVEEGEPGGRFEINHHPFRLEQSRCFQASGLKLSCLTCHDPHRKVPPEERAAHYRAACLTCHEETIADHPPVSATGSAPSDAAPAVDPLASDCTSCHMPERRTADVVHVVMTDHRIVRWAEPADERLAPRAEEDPVVTGLELLRPAHAPEGALGEVYRAAAVVRASPGFGAEAVDHLAANLERARPADPEPWLDLAKGEIQLQRFASAETTLQKILARDGAPPGVRREARRLLALARSGQGEHEEAIAILRDLVATDPDRIALRMNLGRLLLGTGKPMEAVEHLERAQELRPNQVAAWELLGIALLELNRPSDAAEALRQAVILDPTRTRAYLLLADALVATDRRDEAVRHLRHGTTVARDPETVRAKLDGL